MQKRLYSVFLYCRFLENGVPVDFWWWDAAGNEDTYDLCHARFYWKVLPLVKISIIFQCKRYRDASDPQTTYNNMSIQFVKFEMWSCFVRLYDSVYLLGVALLPTPFSFLSPLLVCILLLFNTKYKVASKLFRVKVWRFKKFPQRNMRNFGKKSYALKC